MEELQPQIVVHIDRDLAPLIPAYLDNRRRDVGQLTDALQEGNFEKIVLLGYHMSGSGLSYGFSEVTAIGNALESAAKAQDYTTIARLIHQLAHYLNDITIRWVNL